MTEQSIDQNNVVSIGNTKKVQTVIQRFNVMVETVTNKKDILEKPHIDILLFETSLSDNEVSGLSLYIKNFMKNMNVLWDIKDIEYKIKSHSTAELDWADRNYVGEKDGRIFIQKTSKSIIYTSNFVLTPVYTIKVNKGQKYHVYEVKVINDYVTYTLMLTAEDFNTQDGLQKKISEQLSGTSAYINNCAKYMGDLAYKYIDLAPWQFEKQGTSLIGLERLEDNGPKYFCTPNAIFNMEGQVSNDIVFMGNEHSNEEEIRGLSNLDYNKNKWEKEIVPTVLKNIIHMGERMAMLSLAGWMASIPHDYVIRKECGTSFFPHCHIVGEPGSGKSTIMTELKQLMGHNDSAPRTFPTPFEVSKLLNSSYTIPAVLDEYGKRWRPDQVDGMNKILVESFNKAKWSRGRSDLGSIYFKYKNPILMGGQIPTTDGALSTRIVPVSMYKSFHRTPQGKKAFEHLTKMQKMKDKNFWVGFNLWCAKFSNKEVEDIYQNYRTYARNIIPDSRVADIYAIVMLGLNFFKKLAEEFELSDEIGYTDEDIMNIPQTLDNSASITDTKDVSPLNSFLEEVATFAIRHGNGDRFGKLFGTGLAVMSMKPSKDGAGEYGNTQSNEACIYGRQLILIKIEDMVRVLNEKRPKDPYNPKEIMTFIESEFRKSMNDPDNGLVLAPKQYKTKYGRYTAFNKEKLVDLYGEYDRIQWYDNLK